MRVSVKLLGYLALKIGAELALDIEAGSTLGGLISSVFREYGLGSVPQTGGSSSVSPGYLRILLNGRAHGLDAKLSDDDVVTIMPPLVGG